MIKQKPYKLAQNSATSELLGLACKTMNADLNKKHSTLTCNAVLKSTTTTISKLRVNFTINIILPMIKDLQNSAKSMLPCKFIKDETIVRS